MKVRQREAHMEAGVDARNFLLEAAPCNKRWTCETALLSGVLGTTLRLLFLVCILIFPLRYLPLYWSSLIILK